MGVLFTLDAEIREVIQQALDDLITELGKDCRLVYPPKATKCPNCVNNIWRTGGPVPFNVGTACPLCGTKGTIEKELSDDIKMLCAWTPKDFFIPLQRGINVELPQGLVQTKFYLTDMPKVLRADHLIFQTGIEAYIRYKYKLWREPGDPSNIIQGRYAVATWQRAG